jgi:hypothetical protein
MSKKWIPRTDERIIIQKGTPIWWADPKYIEARDQIGRRTNFDESMPFFRRAAWAERRRADRMGDLRARKTYEVVTHAIHPWGDPRWVGWVSGRQIKWAKIKDVMPVPTELEMLADVPLD